MNVSEPVRNLLYSDWELAVAERKGPEPPQALRRRRFNVAVLAQRFYKRHRSIRRPVVSRVLLTDGPIGFVRHVVGREANGRKNVCLR